MAIVGVSTVTLVARGEGYPAHPVWAGQTVPADADPEQVALLLEEGHLRDTAGPQPAPLVHLGAQDLPVAPARSASREAWEAYLHVVGYTAEETAGYGRNDLRDFTLPPDTPLAP